MRFILKQKKRIFAYIALCLLLLFVISPLFSLFYLFNEAKIKNQILANFNNQNYHVTINGHITPELWHGLSIKIHSISIASKNEDKLLHIGSMSCQFSWVDAVFGKYKLARVSINDVDFYEQNILKYGLHDLLSHNNLDPSMFKNLVFFAANDIHSIGSNAPYNFDAGNIKVTFDNDLPELKLGFKLLDKNIYLGIVGTFNNFTQTQLNFNQFNTYLYNDAFNVETTGTALYNFKTNTTSLTIKDGTIKIFDYSGKIKSQRVNISPKNVTALDTTLNLNLSKDLIQQNLIINADQISSSDLKNIAANRLLVTYNNSLQHNSVNMTTQLNNVEFKNNSDILSKSCTNTTLLKAPDIIANTIQTNFTGTCNYIALNKLFLFKLNGLINNSPINLNLQVHNTVKPQVLINANINRLNLANTTENKFLPLYYDKSPLPFSWVSYLNLTANLNFMNLTLNQIKLDNLKTTLRIKDSELHIDKLNANLYNGSLNATGSIIKNNNNSYNIITRQHFGNLDIKSMFKNLFDVTAISGKANIKTDIRAENVFNYADIHNNLSGKVNIEAKNGAFQGIDFNLFTSPKTLSLTTIKSTPFNQLLATFDFKNGISKNGTINFSSPFLVTDGTGKINFKKTTLDYALTIKSVLPHNHDKINAVVIPVTATGDLFNPKINIVSIHLSNKKNILHKNYLNKRHSHHKPLN